MAALPADTRPASRQDGYAIQATLEARSAKPLFGWKIAATSRAGQSHIGVDGPLAGRLLAERAFGHGARLEFGRNHMGVAEPEFAFRLGQDLPARREPYDVDDLLAAIDALHPALEIPDSRFEDFATVGAPQLIADNACAHEFVLGPEAPDIWRNLDLATHKVTGSVVGSVTREGTGANVLDGPLIALTWIVNELSSLNISLRAGQVITTGTCLEPLPVRAGTEVIANFGVLGTVSLTFR